MGEKLGVLGGMGPQATQVFYQRVIDRTDAERDQDHVPTLIWSDTSIPDRTSALLSGRGEEVYERLLADVKLLEQCGCGVIAIPCNTSHYFVDRLQGEVGVPILHMVRLTAARMAERGVKHVAILATEGTVKTGVYQRECEAMGLRCWCPDEAIQTLVTEIIYDEIKKGERGSREKFAAIDRAVRAAGCDGAILGCTELSVYRAYHPLPEFYLDAMEVLSEECILRCGKKLTTV